MMNLHRAWHHEHDDNDATIHDLMMMKMIKNRFIVANRADLDEEEALFVNSCNGDCCCFSFFP
jgi:hypothetical protein